MRTKIRCERWRGEKDALWGGIERKEHCPAYCLTVKLTRSRDLIFNICMHILVEYKFKKRIE